MSLETPTDMWVDFSASPVGRDNIPVRLFCAPMATSHTYLILSEKKIRQLMFHYQDTYLRMTNRAAGFRMRCHLSQDVISPAFVSLFHKTLSRADVITERDGLHILGEASHRTRG